MRGIHPSTTMLQPTEGPPYNSIKTVPRIDSNEQRTRQVAPLEEF